MLSKRNSYIHFLLHKVFKGRIRGFTLIESMVVVGITGLVIGIGVSSLNVQRNNEYAHDAVRKSDLNTIHKALVQYYIENRCIPPQSLWDGLSCNEPVPEVLAPYLSSLPCDPETNEKYAYETLDKQCKQCNGGCGVCLGFRLLAQLKHPGKNDDKPEAGCKKDEGCGKKASNGKPYNYGLIMSNSCTVPTPTRGPTPTTIPTVTVTPSVVPTVIPTPTPTVIPTPIPTAIPTQMPTLTCNSGQLIQNGSFEIDQDNDKKADNWLIYSFNPLYHTIDCNTATDGNCSLLNKSNNDPVIKNNGQTLNQTIPVSIPKGSLFTFSIDAKSSSYRTTQGYTNLTGFLYLKYTDGTYNLFNTSKVGTPSRINNMRLGNVGPQWVKIGRQMFAEKDVSEIEVEISTAGLYSDIHYDNLQITCTSNPEPLVTQDDTAYCPGNLISNGSFEKSSPNWLGKTPYAWFVYSIWGTVPYQDELRNCQDGSNSNCSLYLRREDLYVNDPSYDGNTHRIIPTVWVNNLNIKKGDKLTYSYDWKIYDSIATGGNVDSNLDFRITNVSAVADQYELISVSNQPESPQWRKYTKQITANNNYNYLELKFTNHLRSSFRVDNLCLRKM